ncbi:CDP-diacylglycerol--glycerol-3-phosphate 3-phosphatidyltransferase [Galbitalea sp. SE-J8]|uniref:CDP-diacylglycerol--glycerol-3-phosphate 3-phosphatidyltransferase n=1 Tax=Galbitalea sp. SE-J8 TaxID=3054952 RepID=UPI00259CC0AC|nr:CDP-diacylglycerol--glycerol-3-phosphate 3-phosphatidyltransferase [Galbitalea sp. SE-J8]MDM4762558.1 CDP-diacylglycerol--glycerol-3-phosphate 3-phosphatidyltransferase [Galbitalea sp. SE-J8]
MTSAPARSNWFAGRFLAAGETPASPANIANVITVVRILLAPVFIALVLIDDGAGGALRWVAAVVFVVVIATDALDGHLARSRNLVTDIGKILDPIADKVLTGGALVALSILGELWWWVTIVILVREFGITVFRFIALRDRVIPASRGGKIKTWVQSVAITVALMPLAAALPWWGWLAAILLGAALVLTVVTGADYLWQAWRRNRS